MDKRDIAYYKAHVADVVLEDITSSERNANILRMLRDGDDEWNNKLYLLSAEIDGDPDEFVVGEDDDLGWLGYFIGESEYLEYFFIFHFPEGEEKLDEFMSGLAHNQSIENLFIKNDLGEGYLKMGPLLRNSNCLIELTFAGPDIGRGECARKIATMLGQEQCKSLKSISFVQNNVGVQGFEEITSALKMQPQLEELKFCGSNIGREGCLALAATLEGWTSPKLKKLHLCHNDIDDEGLQNLMPGLRNCCGLEALVLCANSQITAAGLSSLSSLLQSDSCCSLNCLDLDSMNICDVGASALAAGLTGNKSMKYLFLSGNSIGDAGLQVLSPALASINLEKLHLANNSYPVCTLSTLLQRSMNLTELNLSNAELDDAGLRSVVAGLANCCNLEKLNLSDNASITAAGLRSLSPLLHPKSECYSLRELYLYGMDVCDDCAGALADGLKGNTSLEQLHFCPGHSSISVSGWSAFSKVLFDTSSVNNTFLSNHTLEQVGGHQGAGSPEITRFHLFLNRTYEEVSVAMYKILLHHRDIDMTPLFRWKLMFVPLVVGWFDRARPCWEEMRSAVNAESVLQSSEMSALHEFFVELGKPQAFQSRQLSAVYKFVRGMPMLVVGNEEDEI